MEAISATSLARSTRLILDRVATRGETVIVQRNNVGIAKIVPAEQTMTAAQALAGLPNMLTPKQSDAWLRESKSAFDETVHDPWE